MVVLTLVKIDVKLFETYSILRGLGVQPISHLRVEQDFKKNIGKQNVQDFPDDDSQNVRVYLQNQLQASKKLIF